MVDPVQGEGALRKSIFSSIMDWIHRSCDRPRRIRGGIMGYSLWKGSVFSTPRRWLILLLCLFPVLSCTTVKQAIWPPTQTSTPTSTSTPTPTPTNTPTPTRIPLAERDLRDIALQKSDLPDPEGFVEFDIPDIQDLAEDMDGSAASPLMQNVVKGYASFFNSIDGSAMFANLILVYQDVESAETAFEEYIDGLSSGEEIDLPLIGDVSIGVTVSSSRMTSFVIAWRYEEAFLELDYVGEDDIDIEEMIRMAQAIQSRLEDG